MVDGTTADEFAPPPPEAGEMASEGDVVSEPDSTNPDAGVDADADADAAPRDASSEDVAVESVPVPDGSCNSPFTCAAPVPAGWTGPALLWTAPVGSQEPSCPADYQLLDNLRQGLMGTEPGSCKCSCSLSDDCVVTVTFHPDSTCSTPTCQLPGGGMGTISVNPPSDGGCTPIPDNVCGSGGSVTTTNPTAYTASCVPNVTPIPSPSWTNSAALCATTCGATGKCIIGPTSSFGDTACIYQSGDSACPGTAYVNKHVFYSGFMDNRTCTACTCNGVDGGTCVYLGGSAGPATSLSAYAGSDCMGTTASPSAWQDITLDVCSVYISGSLSPNPTSLTYNPTIRHGSCSGVATTSMPGSGGVAATGATTVCCM